MVSQDPSQQRVPAYGTGGGMPPPGPSPGEDNRLVGFSLLEILRRQETGGGCPRGGGGEPPRASQQYSAGS